MIRGEKGWRPAFTGLDELVQLLPSYKLADNV